VNSKDGINEKVLIVYNNKLHETTQSLIEKKLNQLTWQDGYTSWFFYRFRYYEVNHKDSLIYFTNWTYFSIIRVIFRQQILIEFFDNFFYIFQGRFMVFSYSWPFIWLLLLVNLLYKRPKQTKKRLFITYWHSD